MKNPILSLALCGFTISAAAQSTITDDNFSPQVGENISRYELDDSLASTGADGANCTWDFSALAGGMLYSDTYISPVGIPGSGQFFPNRCIHNAPGDDYRYYSAVPEGYRYLGFTDATGQTGTQILFPALLYPYPMTYPGIYTEAIDERHQDIVSGNEQRRTGVHTWTVQGYGTLMLPTGAFANALKVRIETLDTFNYENNITNTRRTVSTEWLYPGIHSPLLSSEWSVTTIYNWGDPFSTSSSRFSTYTNQSPLAVNEALARDWQLCVWPQPAGEEVTLGLTPRRSGVVSVSVFNAAGQPVRSKQKTVSAVAGKWLSLDVPLIGLPTGMYLVDLEIAGVHLQQRVAKK